MADSERLEEQILRIFVENNAIALFNVKKPLTEPVKVTDIQDLPGKTLYGAPYNFLVNDEETAYFSTEGYHGELRTISVTDPCIVFCLYTTGENKRVKSSGVYHARGYIDKNRLYALIRAIRAEPKEKVIVKAVGSDNQDKEYLQRFRNYLAEFLAAQDIEINPDFFLLGGPKQAHRRTEFDPLTGQLITYLSYGREKTVI